MPHDFSQIGPFLVAAIVVFAIYRRLRRSFGRQLLLPVRMTVRVVALMIIGCALLPKAMQSVPFLSAELAGAALGIGLSVWGAERTRFLMHNGRLHYVPHTYTGIVVSLLFLGRLSFRLVQVFTGIPAPHAGTADPAQAFAATSMVRSPLTVGILFVLIGYYVCFYSWVLWKSKRLKAEDIEEVSVVAPL